MDKQEYLSAQHMGAPNVFRASASPQTTANNTWANVALGNKIFDRWTIGDPANNTKLAPNQGGIYLIGANLIFNANVTGIRILLVLLNGATTLAVVTANAVTAGTSSIFGVTIFDMSPGDYIQILGFQTSGGNLDITCTAWMRWVGKP